MFSNFRVHKYVQMFSKAARAARLSSWCKQKPKLKTFYVTAQILKTT